MPRSDQANGALHAWASVGMAIVIVGLGGGLYAAEAAGGDDDRGPDLDDMEAIEASLAYRKAEPKKQPQKKRKAPPPPKDAEKISRDADKDPVEPKKDEPVTKPPDDLEDLYKQMQEKRQNDEDAEYGKPTEPDQGAFDGSEYGFAEETKGDPYFQKLVADLVAGWTYPKLLDEHGDPVGCMRLEKDGTVSDTLFKQKSGNAELDDSVERALKAVVKLRKEEPAPVPSHLLKHTTRWICFKFTVPE